MDRIVSFDDEPLILVDAQDREVGVADKASCHVGDGKLHRALSVFLFDEENRLLLQQRSVSKRLWPGVWANSCCSHPRRGESTPAAAVRRVREELGLEAELQALFSFEYHAHYGSGSEHELCHVFIGRLVGVPQPNAHEIAALKLMTPQALDEALRVDSGLYAPWLHLEWARLRGEYWQAVLNR